METLVSPTTGNGDKDICDVKLGWFFGACSSGMV